MEIPYNDEMIVVPSNRDIKKGDDEQYQGDQPMSINNLNNIHRGILGNTYNPNSDSNIRSMIITKSNQNNNNKGVLTNVYDGNSGSNLNRVNNNFAATNHGSGVNSRSNPNNQIITKNGLLKKTNLTQSEYTPFAPINKNKSADHDHIYAQNPPNKHYPSNNHPSFTYNPSHNFKNDFDSMRPSTSSSLADRKSTCMLYLQADHTFYQKMGSDEASIEAITRHVQRANLIYRNTGEQDVTKFFHFFKISFVIVVVLIYVCVEV